MNEKTVRNIGKSLLISGASVTAVIAGLPALAQDSGVDDNPITLDRVVTTGSHIARERNEVSPIVEIDQESYQEAMSPSVAEFFRDLTITTGSITLGNAEDGGQSPTASINLRGIGPRGTLVLLNGTRQTVGAIPTDDGILAVDVNGLVPSIMISRIDVLKDGASALYGSDAVAGVVNFVTRDQFEGAELSVDYDYVESAESGVPNINALFGLQGDRGGIVFAAEYYDRDRLEIEDAVGLNQIEEFGVTSTFGNPGTFTLPRPGPNDIQQPDPLCGDPSLGEPNFSSFVGRSVGGGLAPGGTNCRLNISLGRSVAASSERLLGLTRAHYDLTDQITASGEIGFSRIRSDRSSGYSSPLTSGVFNVPASNPGNIYGEDALFRGRVRGNFHGDPVITEMETDTWRVSGSLEGQIPDGGSGWGWRATALYSRNDSMQMRTDTIGDNLRLALNGFGGAGCDPDTGTAGVGDCVYYNPFASSLLAAPGDATYNDPEIFDFVLGDQTQQSNSTLRVIEGVVNKTFGDLGFALGYQYRSSKFENDFDTLSNNGDFTFFTRGFDYEDERDTHAVFTEVVLPVGDMVEVQLAGRYESFDNGSDTFDPKVGIAFTPNDNLKLRGTWGTSFRQPGPVQLNGASEQSANFNVPGGRITSTASKRGDPDLKPEEAEVLTIGADYNRDLGSGRFNFTIDYWDISFTDLIVEPTPESIFFTDPTDPRIVFDSFCTIGVDCTPGNVVGFDIQFVNAASLDTSGIDLNAGYSIDTANSGTIDLSLAATRTLTYDIVQAAGEDSIDAVGFLNVSNLASPVPEWSAVVSAQWSNGPHTARGSVRYLSGVEDETSDLTEDDAFTTFDVSYQYDWDNFAGAPLSLRLGVINVTDEKPPAKANTLTTVSTLLHDPRGRVFRIGLHRSF
ncbi:MAG: TonB-dependent receptor [Henriciella sp.]|nr:TonB-dependent receptor [Henriciella sp.]